MQIINSSSNKNHINVKDCYILKLEFFIYISEIFFIIKSIRKYFSINILIIYISSIYLCWGIMSGLIYKLDDAIQIKSCEMTASRSICNAYYIDECGHRGMRRGRLWNAARFSPEAHGVYVRFP